VGNNDEGEHLRGCGFSFITTPKRLVKPVDVDPSCPGTVPA